MLPRGTLCSKVSGWQQAGQESRRQIPGLRRSRSLAGRPVGRQHRALVCARWLQGCGVRSDSAACPRERRVRRDPRGGRSHPGGLRLEFLEAPWRPTRAGTNRGWSSFMAWGSRTPKGRRQRSDERRRVLFPGIRPWAAVSEGGGPAGYGAYPSCAAAALEPGPQPLWRSRSRRRRRRPAGTRRPAGCAGG